MYVCIEALFLGRLFVEIFDFKNADTLKTGLGSVKVIGNVTIRYSVYDFLLTFYSNYGSISCRSETFNVEKCRDLEIGVKGHSRSLKVIPLDRLYMVSY